MTPDTEFAEMETRLARTLTVMAQSVPDEVPVWAPADVAILDRRRHGRRILVAAAALTAAAAVAGVALTTGDGSHPSIRLGGERVAPAAPAPTDGLVAVPDVVGLPLDRALQVLVDAGFTARVGGTGRGDPTDLVRVQNPTGRAAAGATVELTVAPA